MLKCKTSISIKQNPNEAFPNRSNSYIFDYVTDLEIKSTWESLTDMGKMVLPKNLYMKDADGKNTTWFNKAIINSDNPILLRGDSISVSLGYEYRDSNNTIKTEMNEVFKGYLTMIKNRIPIEIEFQDNMYVLKQIQAANKTWSGYTVQEMVQEMIGDRFTVVNEEKTSIGDFVTSNETVCQVLSRLKKDYGLESFFVGDKLYCAGFIYSSLQGKEVIFDFQKNIIDDDLDYKRKDDQKIVVKAISVFVEELNATRSDGTKKTRKHRLTVNVPNEDPFAEVRTFHFFNARTKEELTKLANDRLKKIWYSGLDGDFETFGLPFARFGDIADIRDNVVTERTGKYFIKSVTYKMGMNGYRQTIELDQKTSS